jgi:hypothetical protein
MYCPNMSFSGGRFGILAGLELAALAQLLLLLLLPAEEHNNKPKVASAEASKNSISHSQINPQISP